MQLLLTKLIYLKPQGLRFAMIEMKILLAKIILNYEILTCEETQVK